MELPWGECVEYGPTWSTPSLHNQSEIQRPDNELQGPTWAGLSPHPLLLSSPYPLAPVIMASLTVTKNLTSILSPGLWLAALLFPQPEKAFLRHPRAPPHFLQASAQSSPYDYLGWNSIAPITLHTLNSYYPDMQVFVQGSPSPLECELPKGRTVFFTLCSKNLGQHLAQSKKPNKYWLD